jgi:hypothetical protein
MIGLSVEDARRAAAASTPVAPAPPAATIVGMPAHTIVAGTPLVLDPARPAPDAAPAAPAPAAPPAGAAASARTIVGMMSPEEAAAVARATAAARAASSAGASAAQKTMVGVAAPRIDAPLAPRAEPRAAPPRALAPVAGSVPSAAPTMLGVAMPGIAPLHPGEAPPDEPAPEPRAASPRDVRNAAELGATGAPVLRGWTPPPAPSMGPDPRAHRPKDRARRAPQPPPAPSSRRALYVVGAAGVLAVGAVLFAVLWPSAPPLTARARVDAAGREGVEITCPTCPDGTTIAIGDAKASMTGHVAQVPLAAPLTVGENRLKVAIDRPGGGRDETVGVNVPLAYRIRPDLETLQGERPALQIVVEAQAGTAVTLGGKPVALAAGRALETVDVTDAVTGPSDEVTTLSRQVPYSVKPKDGVAEQGMVNVSVSVVPLHLDAPGPSAVIDGKTFVLAGRSLKGAEVSAAGRPIQVKPDGTFAQVMNVSSVGATQIEVRARLANMAPRITRIDVRRVDDLAVAAREFAAQSPLGWADVAPNPAAVAGKPVLLGGEVVDVRRQNHQTVMLLDVGSAFGCKATAGSSPCHVRLVQGADNDVKQGAEMRAFGHVTRAFSVAGRPDIPEVWVDFTLKGLR